MTIMIIKMIEKWKKLSLQPALYVFLGNVFLKKLNK